jgi:hypothetical protein
MSMKTRDIVIIISGGLAMALGIVLVEVFVPKQQCGPLPPTYEKDLGALRCWYQNPPDKCVVVKREPAPLYCEKKAA